MSNRDDDDEDEGDDYPRRFKSDYEADDSEFDASDDEPKRGPLAFAIALGILLVVSAVIWNAYRSGIREGGRDAPPRITAEGPAKIAPIDPGGATVPGQDVAVYDELEEAQTVDANAPPEVISPREPAALKPSTSVDDAALAIAPPVPVKPVAAAGGPAGPSIAPANAGAISFVRNGPFLAQVAALRSQEAADTEWTKISRLAPDLFNQAQKDIQRADLGAKGVFYRLRAGSFASRSSADAFCDQVQAAGQGCIVATR